MTAGLRKRNRKRKRALKQRSGSAMKIRGAALVALVLLPVGLAPDPDPFARCRGGDVERIKACIRDEVERRVAALPPPPEQAGPPLWLCDSPECRDRLGIACVLRPPSRAAYEARQKALEAWRR